MSAAWFGLKRPTQCKSGKRDVHDPKRSNGNNNLCSILTKKSGCGRSGCSRSIANLKDVVIPGSRRHATAEKPPICSPRSIGSSDLLMNSVTHEVVVNNSTCELKISAAGCGFHDSGGVSGFVGMLKPGTPGPGRLHSQRGLGRRSSSNLSWRSPGFGGVATPARPRSSFGSNCQGSLFCHKCGEQFARWEAVEKHHLSKHAVTELAEGDSSRKIVEIICRGDNQRCKIDRILKVHNMQRTLTQFEEYRELVKVKAGRLPKKHSRCLADGNELLRFHGAILGCDLGKAGCSNLCTSDKCEVCRILRHGWGISDGIGVFTASTSSKALESVEALLEDDLMRKALIVCRVIAGRVHRPLENVQEIVAQSGFDSLAGTVGVHSNIEDLYLLSHRALLPCFLVVYKS